MLPFFLPLPCGAGLDNLEKRSYGGHLAERGSKKPRGEGRSPQKTFLNGNQSFAFKVQRRGGKQKSKGCITSFVGAVIESSEEKNFRLSNFREREIRGRGGRRKLHFSNREKERGGDSPPICMRGRASKTRSKTNGSRGHSILPLSPLFVSIRSFLPSSHSS